MSLVTIGENTNYFGIFQIFNTIWTYYSSTAVLMSSSAEPKKRMMRAKVLIIGIKDLEWSGKMRNFAAEFIKTLKK